MWRVALALTRVLSCALFVSGIADAAPAEAVPEVAVRFAPERDYGPFVYESAAGRIEGLSIDMLGLLARHTGMRLVMLPARSLSENLALARAGQIDLLSSLRPTPERAEYLAFSRPYVEVPAILVVRTGDPAQRLDDLEGRAVAVGQDYAVEDFVRQQHPQVQWRPARDDAQAMSWLRDGKVQALVADAASVHFLRRAADASRLSLRDEIGFSYALSFAVRKDERALLERIDEGLAQIAPRDKAAVIARWLPAMAHQAGPRRQHAWWLGWGLIAAALVVALALLARSKGRPS